MEPPLRIETLAGRWIAARFGQLTTPRVSIVVTPSSSQSSVSASQSANIPAEIALKLPEMRSSLRPQPAKAPSETRITLSGKR